VIVNSPELEALVELYQRQTQLLKLQSELAELASGRALLELQDEILALATEISSQRSLVEDCDREIARVASDLTLVESRISKDTQRLQTSSNPKDISGIQHEMETLAKRKDDLETNELELMETVEVENSKLEQFLARKQILEAQLAAAKESAKTEFDRRKAQILEESNQIEKLRLQPSSELLAIYDQRVTRGVPVGKLLKSTCGACNMSLTSTALNTLQRIPAQELARCPECTAILVR
jgi:predicted  nucleic acid-binding Zn-ribbon protein